MATLTAELRDRADDAVRQAAQVADEARRLVTRSVRDLGDLRDTAAYRIKKAPIMTVGLAFGAGILLGAVVSGIAARRVKKPV